MFKIIKKNLTPIIIATFLIGGLFIMFNNNNSNDDLSHVVDVKVPNLTAQAKQGEIAFKANCASCHGKNAGGSANGPPLIHDIYNSGHHADEAFIRAVKLGVRAHHWPFGNMAAITTISNIELQNIITYVRELQANNGIVSKAHKM